MLTITDINGNTEGLSGYKNLRRYRNVSGEKSLAFFVMPTTQNSHSFEMVAEESIVEFDGEPYRIKQMAEKPRGATYVKEVVAIHTLFDLIDDHKYELHTGSLTFDAALAFVLGGTGYTWVVADTFYVESFENFGDDNRLALLQTVLKRYGAEYTLSGTQLTFRNRIGNETDFQFRYNYNVKTLARDVNTNNLSTHIKGFGKGVTSEYTSPNAAIFGLKHAKPIRDERFTTLDGLNEALKAALIDTPEVSITIDFADMRRAGYPYDVPNEGDDVFLIYEPMGVDLEARLVDIAETFTETSDLPIKTEVTLANIRENLIDRMVSSEKRLKETFGTDGKIKFSVLDGAVQRATEALQSAQTELEFENGITARSKVNPNHIVRITSAGIGVSVDNGATFNYAMTGEGVVADLITVGTMLFDRLYGGTLSIGGLGNQNGVFHILNSNGEMIGDFDADRGGFASLYVDNFNSPTVPRYEVLRKTIHVSSLTGDDSNSGDDTTVPLKTLTEALRRIPKVFDGEVIIQIAKGSAFYENLFINGFLGSGILRIAGNGYAYDTIFGNIQVSNCSVLTELKYFLLQCRDDYSGIGFENSAGWTTGIKVQGNYGTNTTYGIRSDHSSSVQVSECVIGARVLYGICARYGGTVTSMDNTGKAVEYGVYARSGIVMGSGTYPSGTIAAVRQLIGGQAFLEGTEDTAAPPAAPTSPDPITTEWNATSAESWRPQGGWSGASTGADVIQGSYAGYGEYKGLWFFGSAPSTAVTGKTIKQIRVWVQRKSSGGSAGSVSIYIRPHGYTSKPGGDPAFISANVTASLKWGEGKWVTLPSSFHNYFQNGSAKGLGVWANSGSSTYYARLLSSAKLEITYE